MRGNRGELWAAFIRADKVVYFTTQREYRNQLPMTIENWRERFRDKEVVFVSDIQRIPKDELGQLYLNYTLRAACRPWWTANPVTPTPWQIGG